MNALYANCNRNKRAIAVDLSKAEGLDLAHSLLRDAGVFPRNWRIRIRGSSGTR
jgi:crotonobetainyl-CoA:carnitine CoA-transferase CaiB-like acyl-CoA transferase